MKKWQIHDKTAICISRNQRLVEETNKEDFLVDGDVTEEDMMERDTVA